MPLSLQVGTSGWQYRDWRGPFYPGKLPQSAWLEYFAERFATVELNNSFYRLPAPETFAAWAQRTPGDFVMAVKASRYLTHIKRLRDPEQPVQRILDATEPLGRKLGPVLLQLPPTMHADPERLDRALSCFPRTVRVAVELREASWFVDSVRAVLERHRAALCLADRGSKVVSPLWRTADWTFLRFHEGRGEPSPCYGEDALRGWVDRLLDGFDGAMCWVYFNNDAHACAVRDAVRFAALGERAGCTATRTPSLEEVAVS